MASVQETLLRLERRGSRKARSTLLKRRRVANPRPPSSRVIELEENIRREGLDSYEASAQRMKEIRVIEAQMRTEYAPESDSRYRKRGNRETASRLGVSEGTRVQKVDVTDPELPLWSGEALYVYHERLGIGDGQGMEPAIAEKEARRQARRTEAGIPESVPEGVVDVVLESFWDWGVKYEGGSK